MRLGVSAALLAGVAMVGTGGSASADPVRDNACANKAPTGSVPAIPGVYAPADTCINHLQRTLVFVGQSILTNGVNFGGMGDPSFVNSAGKAGGGNFGFDGICVMVDWQSGTGSSAPSANAPIPCEFNTSNGHFEGPTATGNFVGQTLEGKTGTNVNPAIPNTPNANVFGWDPNNQASCFNSSGGGVSAFTSKGAFGTETWTSTFTWTNSLNNFVGNITNGTMSGKFNAKIRTDADPAADKNKLGTRPDYTYAFDVDRTDAGCLDKTLHGLNSSYDNVAPSLLGLRALLTVGTATWDIVAPGLG